MTALVLPNGDGRGNVVDAICRGAFDAIQKLTGVRRKCLDIAALSFGVQRIKGQTAFARTTDAADDCQFLVRDTQTDVLQIVNSHSIQFDVPGDSGGRSLLF